MKTPRPDRDFAAQQAAYLLCERQMTQQQIADFLDTSQSKVSRLLARAEDKGWLERRYRFIAQGLTDARREELERMAEPKGLVELLANLSSDTGVRARAPHVVEVGSKGTTDKALERRLKAFGRAAALVLMKLLARSEVFGVTWGGTIRHVVDGLSGMGAAGAVGHPIQFVPVSGEPLDLASNRDTSSNLVERLHRQLQPDEPPPPSLTGVAALIPMSYQAADEKIIRRFLTQSASYRAVFGRPAPLINRIDSLLTSVGRSARPMGFVFDELLRAGSTPGHRLTPERLERLVAGDIGGVLIPRRDLDAAGRAEVNRLNAMWTGMKRSHLERVARSASRSDRPGVIVVSMGKDRVDVIAEALRCGLVNQLIIDRELSDALTRVLAPSPG